MTWTSFDTWIVIIGALCGMSCALPGCYLLLRRLSMMGDAISHTVLPGIAVAFLLTGTRDSLPMFVGACVVGVLTALLVHTVNKYGDLDEGASMGVIFTSLFALGLVLIRQAADRVDLDPDCVLFGAIELAPLDVVSIAGHDIPRAALTNGALLLVNLAFVTAFYKELKLTAFDPALARTLGYSPAVMHYALMVLVAATAVAAFESVGSIIVIAMLIVPAACGFLLTQQLGRMIVASLVMAALAAVTGHGAALALPFTPVGRWLGSAETSSAGMMGTMAGVLFFLTLLFAPHQGLVSRAVGHLALALRITRDDVLGVLYRAEEADATGTGRASTASVLGALRHRPGMRYVLMRLRQTRRLTSSAAGHRLTDEGSREAARLVRSHRLWESYLVKELGRGPEQVHGSAHRLEHVTDRAMREQMEEEIQHSPNDPHQRRIPPEADARQ